MRARPEVVGMLTVHRGLSFIGIANLLDDGSSTIVSVTVLADSTHALHVVVHHSLGDLLLIAILGSLGDGGLAKDGATGQLMEAIEVCL